MGLAVLVPLFCLQLLFCWLGAKPRARPYNVETTPWLQQWGRSPSAILSSLPWSGLAFGLLLLVMSLFLLVPAWEDRALGRNGIAGTVDPREYTAHYDRFGNATSWTCAGPYTSDDGKLRIDRVLIEPDLEQQPDAPVAAKVAGAGSAVASTDTEWLERFVIGLVFLRDRRLAGGDGRGGVPGLAHRRA